jgi:hypothetical protein
MSSFNLDNLETTAAMLGFSNVTVSVDMTTKVVSVTCEDAEGNLMRVDVDGVQQAIDAMQARLSALLQTE